MTSPILPLREITPEHRKEVGGKGLHLGTMASAGLPVPEGWVATTRVFENFLRSAGLYARAERLRRHPNPDDARALARDIAAPSHLPAIANALHGVVPPDPHQRYAVRSSAVDEDGVERSFAGQHHTALGVAPADVAAAVQACWASLYSASALAYRAGGLGPPPGGMAVVVQRLIAPRCSGVLFTINALNGSWNEMVVESTWGLGEPLVSGWITPHWYLVRRPGRVLRWFGGVASRARLKLVQQDLPEIPDRWVAGDRGSHREPVPAELRRQPTLDRETLFRLCALGLQLEQRFGAPQDVEWAVDGAGQIHLLQSRPITAAGPTDEGEVLWTRRFIGERWPEPATPLGWSMLAPVFEWFIAYPETQRRQLGGGPALKLHRSRPYLNVTAFRHLAFKLPGAPAPRFMLELLPPEEEAAWQLRFARAPGVAVYAGLLRETLLEQRWRRFHFNPLTNHLRWEEFQARLQIELPSIGRNAASEADAMHLIDAQIALVREYIGVHITSLLFANLYYQLLEAALATWVPEQAAEWLPHLATCPPGNLTLAANEALWRLAREASADDLRALAARTEPSPRFGAALQAFLAEFGHRSSSSWEIFAPRWADHPEALVPLLEAHRRPGSEAPLDRARSQQQAFEAAHRALKAAPIDRARRFAVDGLVHLARQHLLLRENQRFWFDRLLYTIQRTALGLGDRLARRGVLEAAADIAFLHLDELRAVVDRRADAATLGNRIRERKAERERDNRFDPPVFLRSSTRAEEARGMRLQGLGISPGRVRGRARILRDPADGWRLEPGDILVARGIDPGWTPLFLNAGGIVLEMGSRLSHGAVVAREYRLPAVVNLEGITERITDGQEVTVDGTRGAVWLHPEGA